MSSTFATDMNDRERRRFVEALRMISESATAMSTALESGEDEKLLGPSLLFTMSILQVQDLFQVLASATNVDTSDLDKPFGFGPVAGDGTDGD